MTISSHWCILCEGKSEITYLKLLSRFIRDTSSAFSPPVSFMGRPPNFGIGGGHLRDIARAYKQECPHKGNKQIRIWVDADVPLREKAKTPSKFAQGWANSLGKWSFAFSPLVFEDFLAMHFPDDLFRGWKATLAKTPHFTVPLVEEEYLPLFRDFWHEITGESYDKGSLPENWVTEARLRNLFNHYSDSAFLSPVLTLTTNPSFPEFLHAQLFHANIIPDLPPPPATVG